MKTVGGFFGAHAGIRGWTTDRPGRRYLVATAYNLVRMCEAVVWQPALGGRQPNPSVAWTSPARAQLFRTGMAGPERGSPGAVATLHNLLLQAPLAPHSRRASSSHTTRLRHSEPSAR